MKDEVKSRKSLGTQGGKDVSPRAARLLCAAEDGVASGGTSLVWRANGLDLSPEQAVRKCRDLQRYNWFVQGVLRTRAAFVNYGLEFVGEKKALKGWKGEEEARAWVDELVEEWLLLDGAVTFWRPSSVRPMVLSMEKVKYTDALGEEKLEVTHGLSAKVIDGMTDLTAQERQVLKTKGRITLPDDLPSWRFRVMKRAKLGEGFGMPGLAAVFVAAEELQGHEAGDGVVASAGRLLIEQHLLGHEPKAGVYAGQQRNGFSTTRRDDILKALRGKSGHHRMPTNFDHKIQFVRVDDKLLGSKRYEGVMERLVWWSHPLGHLVEAKSFNPYLMTVLAAQVWPERDRLRRHIEWVLNNRPPAGVTSGSKIQVRWSNQCFLDLRVFLDMVKAGLTAGPVSQTAFVEGMGLNPQVERERKSEEAGLPKEQTMPLFDPNHGKSGKPMEGQAGPGKTPGTKDQG